MIRERKGTREGVIGRDKERWDESTAYTKGCSIPVAGKRGVANASSTAATARPPPAMNGGSRPVAEVPRWLSCLLPGCHTWPLPRASCRGGSDPPQSISPREAGSEGGSASGRNLNWVWVGVAPGVDWLLVDPSSTVGYTHFRNTYSTGKIDQHS